MIEAGLGRVDITCFEQDMVMLGWGQLDNRVQGVHTPLYARALVLRTPARKLAIVSAEVLFISTAVRHAVLERLEDTGIGPHELMLTATHTHSGPSGFTHFLGYNATNFGYSPEVFEAIVDGIERAIRIADARLEPAALRVGSTQIPLDEPVAFNRSVRAYNNNRDVEPVPIDAPERATHRESTTLRVDGADRKPLGAINWFGVHGSSIHADNRLIDADNKGLAAKRFEDALREEHGGDPVALFLQESAGDVSPNFRADPARGVAIGTREDDRESASDNADIQVRYARIAHRAAEREPPLAADLRCAVEHVDFAGAYVNGERTGPPVLGLGMAAGTDEGPGPLRPVAPFLRAVSRLSPFDPKLPWLSADRGAEGRFLGVIPLRLGLRIVSKIEPRIAFVKAADDAGLVGDAPLLPSVLPVQVLWIGDLLIGGVPFEPTTVTGRRLRAALDEHGGRVVLATYANAYAGYAATPEEYRTQHYEGSATYFGENTVPALINAMRWLALSGGARPGDKIFGPEPELLEEAGLLEQRRMGRLLMPGTEAAPGDEHE